MLDYNFSDFLAATEGTLLPDRRPVKGLARINPFPTTNAHRVRIRVRVGRKANPFPPTVRAVVPPWMVPKDLMPVRQ